MGMVTMGLQWGCKEFSALIVAAYLTLFKCDLFIYFESGIRDVIDLSPVKEAVYKTKRIQLFVIPYFHYWMCTGNSSAHIQFWQQLGSYPMKEQITHMPLSTLRK